MIPLTSSEIEHIASASAEAAVRKVLLEMGVNVSEPDAVLKMQADFRHLREWRETTAAIKSRSILTLVALLVTGGAGLLWLAIRGH